MPASIATGTIYGLDFVRVSVEVDLQNGLPNFHIVGLADTAVQEAKQRVKSAIKNSELPFPRSLIVANLAPADRRKAGPAFDLPIALGILAAQGIIPKAPLGESWRCFLGELSLDGTVRGIRGALPLLVGAARSGITECFVPEENLKEASIIPGLNCRAISSLRQIVEHLCEKRLIPVVSGGTPAFSANASNKPSVDFSEIQGQQSAKRALIIAAAGGHNALLSGPPGTGKTLLSRAFPGILPPLRYEESLEASQIWSLRGALPNRQPLLTERPFRAPHHLSSSIAIIGGTCELLPGEASLAHHGVLFLDELPEFSRSVTEALRQPLEDGWITLSRSSGSVCFPARFILIATQNPCPCGNAPDANCICRPNDILRYQRRISGPILDRIDLRIHVPRLRSDELFAQDPAPQQSIHLRAAVQQARERQLVRFQGTTVITNSQMSSRMLDEHCKLKEAERAFLTKAADHFQLSPRAVSRVLKVARTISDLNNEPALNRTALAEALQYRTSRND